MECPHCKGSKSEVLETRNAGSAVRRRRRCLEEKCGERFSTMELVVAPGEHLDSTKVILVTGGKIVG